MGKKQFLKFSKRFSAAKSSRKLFQQFYEVPTLLTILNLAFGSIGRSCSRLKFEVQFSQHGT